MNNNVYVVEFKDEDGIKSYVRNVALNEEKKGATTYFLDDALQFVGLNHVIADNVRHSMEKLTGNKWRLRCIS